MRVSQPYFTKQKNILCYDSWGAISLNINLWVLNFKSVIDKYMFYT
jgi:hypothetical protein